MIIEQQARERLVSADPSMHGVAMYAKLRGSGDGVAIMPKVSLDCCQDLIPVVLSSDDAWREEGCQGGA